MTKSTPAKLEYQRKLNAKPTELKQRAEYNRIRREAIAEGVVKKGDGVDMAHKKSVDKGGSNTRSNVKPQDASKNRGWRKIEPEMYSRRK
jgi:hypothetical protein